MIDKTSVRKALTYPDDENTWKTDHGRSPRTLTGETGSADRWDASVPRRLGGLASSHPAVDGRGDASGHRIASNMGLVYRKIRW